jgi:transcription elongation GreA/GreB family factor
MSDKDLIEARISEIQHTLENVEIIAAGQGSHEIRYGSRVTFEDYKGRQTIVTIV